MNIHAMIMYMFRAIKLATPMIWIDKALFLDRSSHNFLMYVPALDIEAMIIPDGCGYVHLQHTTIEMDVMQDDYEKKTIELFNFEDMIDDN